MSDQAYYWTPEWPPHVVAIIEAEIAASADAMFSDHILDPARPNWCLKCRCAWECPGSVVPTPVEPVNLTRGGFISRR